MVHLGDVTRMTEELGTSGKGLSTGFSRVQKGRFRDEFEKSQAGHNGNLPFC